MDGTNEGHLGGYSEGIIPLIPWSHAKENELRPFIYIFFCGLQSKYKVFHNP